MTDADVEAQFDQNLQVNSITWKQDSENGSSYPEFTVNAVFEGHPFVWEVAMELEGREYEIVSVSGDFDREAIVDGTPFGSVNEDNLYDFETLILTKVGDSPAFKQAEAHNNNQGR